MRTTLSGDEVLALMVKHKINVPVQFVLDCGLVPDPLPSAVRGMTYNALWQIASEEGCVRWFHSQCCERLLIRDAEIMAWGRWTRLHIVRMHPERYLYPCEPVTLTRDQLWNAGGTPSMLHPFYRRTPKEISIASIHLGP